MKQIFTISLLAAAILSGMNSIAQTRTEKDLLGEKQISTRIT